jgi:hypothetical protein
MDRINVWTSGEMMGSSGLAAAHLPGPEQAKPGTMPGNDDGERRAPATPEARQTDPQEAVSRGQFQVTKIAREEREDNVV